MLGEITSDAVEARVLALRTLPFVRDLDDDDLELLAADGHLVHARAGATLWRGGEPLDRVFLLTAGAARIASGPASAGTHLVEDRGTLGLLHLFAGLTEAPTVVIARDATLLEVPADAMMSAFYDSSSIARSTVRIAAASLIAQRGSLPNAPPVPEIGERVLEPPTLVQTLMNLRRAPLWAGASLDAMVELGRHVEPLSYRPGEIVWRCGAPADFAARVAYGIVVCTNASGESVRVGAGAILGGLDALAALPCSYTVEAETEATIFRIPAAAQLTVLEGNPRLAARIRTELARALLLGHAGGAGRAPDALPLSFDFR
ncbi:MAG: cyclic nucleotide-binding domain-containing protein [Polyangiaceae bacterium]